MTVLVFGQTGQVARALGLRDGVVTLGRDKADLTEPQICRDAILAQRPRMVINAAAYTAVDAAETEEALARLINADAPGAMAQACADLDIPFVHVSTDYVFAGTGDHPHRPDDPTGPINAYGRSKLAGERAVRAAGGTHAILRTSWVFDATGRNFVTTMLRLGQSHDSLRIVADQIGGPTPAEAIAAACLRIGAHLRDDAAASGTYHFSGAPETSWAGFAAAIFDRASLTCRAEPISTADYPTAAARPLNSRLDCTTTKTVFGIDRPDWRGALQQYLVTYDV